MCLSKTKVRKLCKFIRNINKSSAPKAVSHPCFCCVYTVYMFISILYVLVYYMYIFSVPLYIVYAFALWCLTPLSTIFQLYRGGIWFMRNKDHWSNAKQYIELKITQQNYDNSKFINKGLEFWYNIEFRF